MKVFIIDVAKCNGCYSCQIACKDEHVANDWTPYAKPQPDTGQFWLKLVETTHGTIPKVRVNFLVNICAHCDNAHCIAACSVKGGIYKRHDGIVVINPQKCTGCKDCVNACPYNAIYFNKDLNIAQKCTGCTHLLDRGWKEPRCVEICPTQAIRFGEESEFADLIKQSEVLHPESDSKSRVYYVNLPGKFVAGTVYDPSTEEVIIDADCVLTDAVNNQKISVKTDGFGDFWFKNLPEGRFLLNISSNGKSKVVTDINTEKDINLGDIPLT